MILENQMFCQLEDHQNNAITHICIEKQCNQSSRWLCQICLNLQIHISDHTTSCNIIDVEDLQDYLVNHIYCKYIESVKYYEKNQANYKDLLEARQLLDEIIENYDKQIKIQEAVAQAIIQFEQNIKQISSYQFDVLLRFQDDQINYETIQNQIKKIIGKLQQTDYKMINFYTCFERQNSYTQKAQISPNENQISYAQYSEETQFKNLQIVNFKINKCLNKKILKEDFDQIIYSKDSQFLYFIDYQGYLRCFQASKSFKQVFNLTIDKNEQYKEKYYQMLFINNKQILISLSNKIIIFDITKRFVLQINLNYQCQTLDYDHRQQQIIASTKNGNFHFMNHQGQLINQININIQIIKIKKTKYDDNILVQNKLNTKLYLYFIDYNKQQLILLNKYEYVENYFQFYSQCNDQKILLVIFGCRIVILDRYLHVIQELPIKGQAFCDQVQSLNFILITHDKNLRILQRSYI